MEELLMGARDEWADGLFYKRDGQVDQAESHFEESLRLSETAVEREPNNAEAHYCAAKALHQLGLLVRAEHHYQRALDLDPGNEQIAGSLHALEMVQQSEGVTQVVPMPRPTVPEPEHAVPPTRDEQAISSEALQPSPEPGLAPDVQRATEADKAWALGEYWWTERHDVEGAEESFKSALCLVPQHEGALTSLSRLLIEQGRYGEAVEYLVCLGSFAPTALEECLAKIPSENGIQSWMRGYIHRNRGEPVLAERHLRQALDVAGDNVPWILTYVEVLQDLNQTAAAAQQLARGVELAPGDASLRRKYARLLAHRRAYEEADKQLKAVIKLDPHNQDTKDLSAELGPVLKRYWDATGYVLLAEVKVAGGSMSEAEALYDRALKLDPTHLRAKQGYAGFLEQEGKFDKAVQMWIEVQAEVPDEAESHLKDILEKQGDDVETLNGLAKGLRGSGRYDEAEEYLERSLHVAPHDPNAYVQLTELLDQTGRSGQADRLLSAHEDIVEKDPALCLRYAKYCRQRHDLTRVKRLVTKAKSLSHQIDPELAEFENEVGPEIARFEQAEAEMAFGMYNPAQAFAHYQKALELDRDHVPTLEKLALLLEKDGKFSEAGQHVMHWSDFDPARAEAHYTSRWETLQSNARAHVAYAQLLKKLGRASEAQEHWRQGAEMQPDDLDVVNPYLELLLEQNELGKAERLLQAGLAQHPNEVNLHWRYAKLLMARHLYDRAKAQADQALKYGSEVSPELVALIEQLTTKAEAAQDAHSKAILAGAQARKGELDDAEALFAQALELCEDYGPAYRDWAQTLMELGHRDAALAQVRRAVALDPYDDRAVQLLNGLEQAPLAAEADEKVDGVDVTLPVNAPVESEAAREEA